MRKIIVSDTFLHWIFNPNTSRLDLLRIIYGEIIIPVAVYQEILQLENKKYDLSEF